MSNRPEHDVWIVRHAFNLTFFDITVNGVYQKSGKVKGRIETKEALIAELERLYSIGERYSTF